MKRITISMLLTLVSLILMGCTQESTKIKSSVNTDPLCIGAAYYNPGCPGYGNGANPTNPTTCTNPTINDKTCYNYCSIHPLGSGCLSNGTNCNIYASAPGCNGSSGNPHPYYGSMYVDRNWQVAYPHIKTHPELENENNCSEPFKPSGISYTPYETRKGTITIKGGRWYNPADTNPDQLPSQYLNTSELLKSVDGARNFFWGDSTLKIRFKAKLQPDSNTDDAICHGRTRNKSTLKGYSRIKFNLKLIGRRGDNSIGEVNLGEKTISIQGCTPAIDLEKYVKDDFPNGIYFVISNVRGNQEWSPTTNWDQYYWDRYGFYPNPAYDGNSYMSSIRSSDCWTLDVEVAADGTKTFN